MRMRWLDGLVLAYGLLLIVMAIYAYAVAHSVMSLIMGGGSGILEIGFAALTQTNPRIGRIGSAAISLVLMGFFIPEALKKGKVDMYILAAASVIVFVCLMGGHFYAMSRRKKSTGQ
ncbi:MAG TPA: TMEM14 family protein [Fimbriimonas sp.]|nr:TMEM14 family protein [Fimbriimonas sp.]